MSEPRDERIETNPDADLAEVLRDDALLDAIGASREPAFAALPDDDVTRLLTAWQSDAATYADERTGPPIPVPVEVPVTPATERPAADPIPHRRRHARPARGGRFAPRSAAAISAAAVAGVVLSVGGVAAAVTGSPLTPLRAVVSGFAPATDQDGAADVTSVTPRELASVRTAIKRRPSRRGAAQTHRRPRAGRDPGSWPGAGEHARRHRGSRGATGACRAARHNSRERDRQPLAVGDADRQRQRHADADPERVGVSYADPDGGADADVVGARQWPRPRPRPRVPRSAVRCWIRWRLPELTAEGAETRHACPRRRDLRA